MMDWIKFDKSHPPQMGKEYIVAAWEFGRSPIKAICIPGQSCLPNQPVQWMLSPAFYKGDMVPIVYLADQVRYYVEVPQITEEMYKEATKRPE